jgi:hypothetical protein
VAEELLEPGEGDKTTSVGNGAIKSLFRDRRVRRMAGTLCAGLAQGIIVYFMDQSPQQWHWFLTAFLLPLPFYLARDVSKRTAAALIPWGALLLLLDAEGIFYENPYVNWRNMTLSAMASAGALMTLPNFVSWIDGEGAFPEWRISFRHLSRMFFSSIIAGLFLLLCFAVLGIGDGLAGMIRGGFRYVIRWFVRHSVIMACTAWGVAFCWTANAKTLLEALERYVLALFSCLMPFLSVLTLSFLIALPVGGIDILVKNGIGAALSKRIDVFWERGFSSGILLGILLASGLCAFAAWQGGVKDDGRPREPFVRPLNILVKAALVPLPIFCPLLVYTIGLRVAQYGWTTDRAVGMFLAAAFGMWSLAWAFFLVKNWRAWPVFYGRVNRIALPLFGIALILLSSPVCDVRRIVLRERLEWLRESVRTGGDSAEFDWDYVARHLGVYGVRIMEDLETGGVAGIHEKFGPFEDESQAVEILADIAAGLASVKEKPTSYGERERKMKYEDFVSSARNAPVFGGELGPDERERLARLLPKYIVTRGGSRSSREVGFFYLEDMDGDGEDDVLLGQGDDVYLIFDDEALLLNKWYVQHGAGGAAADNKAVISADEQKVIGYRWNMLLINGRLFFVDPKDTVRIDSEEANAPGTEPNGAASPSPLK